MKVQTDDLFHLDRCMTPSERRSLNVRLRSKNVLNVAPDVLRIGGTSTVKSRVLVAKIQALTTSPNLEEADTARRFLERFTSKVPALRTQRAVVRALGSAALVVGSAVVAVGYTVVAVPLTFVFRIFIFGDPDSWTAPGCSPTRASAMQGVYANAQKPVSRLR